MTYSNPQKMTGQRQVETRKGNPYPAVDASKQPNDQYDGDNGAFVKELAFTYGFQLGSSGAPFTPLSSSMLGLLAGFHGADLSGLSWTLPPE